MAAVTIYFQGNAYTTTLQSNLLEFQVQVGGQVIDQQSILAIAEYSDSGQRVLTDDQVTVDIQPGSSIIDFTASPLSYRLDVGHVVYPTYEAVFGTFVTRVGYETPLLTATVEDPSVVSFNASNNSFEALTTGETSATIFYRGRSYTIYFVVGVVLHSSNALQTRYVATTGNDMGNDCTVEAFPCATIAHAVSQANDGDILEVASGIYNEPGLLLNKNLDIRWHGVVVIQ